MLRFVQGDVGQEPGILRGGLPEAGSPVEGRCVQGNQTAQAIVLPRLREHAGAPEKLVHRAQGANYLLFQEARGVALPSEPKKIPKEPARASGLKTRPTASRVVTSS